MGFILFIRWLEREILLRVFFLFVQGSEAAAATAVRKTKARRVAREIEPVEFKADRPFIFMIRERHENITLFYGKFLSIPT
jgi:serine protease inhibitor